MWNYWNDSPDHKHIQLRINLRNKDGVVSIDGVEGARAFPSSEKKFDGFLIGAMGEFLFPTNTEAIVVRGHDSRLRTSLKRAIASAVEIPVRWYGGKKTRPQPVSVQ